MLESIFSGKHLFLALDVPLPSPINELKLLKVKIC